MLGSKYQKTSVSVFKTAASGHYRTETSREVMTIARVLGKFWRQQVQYYPITSVYDLGIRWCASKVVVPLENRGLDKG